MKTCLVLFASVLTFLLVLWPFRVAEAQKKKLDLDDMIIKGELHNDDRLLILSRQKNELKNYVKFRTNYRPEILEQKNSKESRRKFN